MISAHWHQRLTQGFDFNCTTNRIGRILVLLVVPLVSVLLAPTSSRAEPVELLVNGSFETGDFTGWTAQVEPNHPFRPWSVSPTGGGGYGMDPVSPQDGRYAAWNGFDGGGPFEFRLDQSVVLPTNQTVTLTWKHRIQWNFTLGAVATQPRLLKVEVLSPADEHVLAEVYSFSTGTQATNPTGDTGWVSSSADLSAFAGSTVILRFREEIPESSTGPAQAEFDAISLTAELTDKDGDGIPDAQDACPMSDLRPTVIIEDCDSGVPNTLFESGCTIADLLASCASEVSNHGAYVRCVAGVLNELKRAELISSADKGAIQRCAAGSTIGHYPGPTPEN